MTRRASVSFATLASAQAPEKLPGFSNATPPTRTQRVRVRYFIAHRECTP
jgi:hypothetical protein